MRATDRMMPTMKGGGPRESSQKNLRKTLTGPLLIERTVVTREISALLAAIAVIVTAGFASPASAIEYPWCAQYTGGTFGGGRNCGFVSYAQCLETIRGMGGFCEPNLFYTTPNDRPAKRVRKHRYTE